MKVSIIIPSINRPELARVCIDSVLKYTTIPYELILVQEGTDKETTKLLKSYVATYIQNKKPKGFGGAMNTGLKKATGDYICFLSDDTVVTPGWIESMVAIFKEEEKVGLVAPTLPDPEITQCIDNNQGQIIDWVSNPFSLKGVCFVMSKESINQVGTWDESFGLGGGEDNDLCYRVHKAGLKLAIARKSFIYHYGSASFRKLFNNDFEYAKKHARAQQVKLEKKHNLSPGVKVYIAIPTVTGKFDYTLALRLIEWSHSTIPLTIHFYPKLVPLDNARNKAVQDFLKSDCTYLLFIDDDITPPSNALAELLTANKDVIAPLCFTFGRDEKGLPFPQPVAHRLVSEGQYAPHYGVNIEETDIVTGGMFLVKREVYERLPRPFAFTYTPDGSVIHSEDFYFSQQCKKLGYKLYTHYGLACSHTKEVDVLRINDLMIEYGR